MIETLENNKLLVWILAVCVLGSLLFTACNFFVKNKELTARVDEVLVQAVVKQKFPGRVTRYGPQQTRYTIEILEDTGQKSVRGNVILGGDYTVNDTLQVWYVPNDPTQEIRIKTP